MNRDTEARGLMRFHTGFSMPNSTPRLSQIPRLLMPMLLRLHLFEESVSVLIAFFGGRLVSQGGAVCPEAVRERQR